MSRSTMSLPDGRELAWRELGDPDGEPVVALHGSPDSSAVWRLVDDAARRHGARIVAPDRPGFGASTPRPGRSILDWVDDHEALVDHLGIGAHRVVTISGGSPYALAVAWARPERVRHVGLLSVICPLHVPGVFRDANRQVRFTFWLARRAPFLLPPMASAMARITLRDPEKAARRLISMRPPADRSIIERPEVTDVLMENLPNQFRDPGSMVTEMRNAARPWGFDLEEVRVPCTVWQGGLDDVHTPAMGRYLAEHLPQAELVYEPDFATFTFFDHLDDLFGRLLADHPG